MRPPQAEDAAAPRLGVLAFGDSITNGGGELQYGVALQSWALWVARGLGLPFTSYAVDGARAHDVIAEQIPAFETRSARPDARFELGCLYIGVNDVRAADWAPAPFEESLRRALGFLTARCDRVLTVLLPLDLGRPRCCHVAAANAIIERAAEGAGALVLDLRGLRGRRVLMPDHVHPTALGQIALAERALDMLAADGLPPRAMPSELVQYQTTGRKRLRSDMTYLYRHAKVSGAALAKRLASRTRSSPAEAAGPEPARQASAAVRMRASTETTALKSSK